MSYIRKPILKALSPHPHFKAAEQKQGPLIFPKLSSVNDRTSRSSLCQSNRKLHIHPEYTLLGRRTPDELPLRLLRLLLRSTITSSRLFPKLPCCSDLKRKINKSVPKKVPMMAPASVPPEYCPEHDVVDCVNIVVVA